MIMTRNRLKYVTFLLGVIILIYTEFFSKSSAVLSIIGLMLLVVGLYLISKGIGEKPDVDPHAVHSYDEEE